MFNPRHHKSTWSWSACQARVEYFSARRYAHALESFETKVERCNVSTFECLGLFAFNPNHKDISSHAGEIDIDVGNPSDYRRVEASVWAGELHVQPFGPAREGLFRSFDWTGPGRYLLNARLKAGELRLHATR